MKAVMMFVAIGLLAALALMAQSPQSSAQAALEYRVQQLESKQIFNAGPRIEQLEQKLVLLEQRVKELENPKAKIRPLN